MACPYLFSHDCVISLFYIKPQLTPSEWSIFCIALYLFSTSNHNPVALVVALMEIALYLFSTSNHNPPVVKSPEDVIALYLFSTSNHNKNISCIAQVAIALYLFSTSNHNQSAAVSARNSLRYISFLHQTTTYIV